MKESKPLQPTHPGRHTTGPMPPPAVPLTLDGPALLHQMFRIRWAAWRSLDTVHQQGVIDEATTALTKMERHEKGGSAIFSQLGHKGDLIII